MLNWEPTDRSGRAIAWASIARGTYDSEIDAEARRLAAIDEPVYVSFSHEPELHWGLHGCRPPTSRTCSDTSSNGPARPELATSGGYSI